MSQLHTRVELTVCRVDRNPSKRIVAAGRAGGRASLVHDILARFSQDFYEKILVGKFPSREISEKCVGRRSLITDIQTQSFLPFHCTQRNVQILWSSD